VVSTPPLQPAGLLDIIKVELESQAGTVRLFCCAESVLQVSRTAKPPLHSMDQIWDEQHAAPRIIYDVSAVAAAHPVGGRIPLVVDPAVECRRCLALRSLRHKFFDALCHGYEIPSAVFEQWQFEALLA